MKFIYDVDGEKLINCAEITVIEIKDRRYNDNCDLVCCSAYAKTKNGNEFELECFYTGKDKSAADLSYEWIENMRLYLTDNEEWIFG